MRGALAVAVEILLAASWAGCMESRWFPWRLVNGTEQELRVEFWVGVASEGALREVAEGNRTLAPRLHPLNESRPDEATLWFRRGTGVHPFEVFLPNGTDSRFAADPGGLGGGSELLVVFGAAGTRWSMSVP